MHESSVLARRWSLRCHEDLGQCRQWCRGCHRASGRHQVVPAVSLRGACVTVELSLPCATWSVGVLLGQKCQTSVLEMFQNQSSQARARDEGITTARSVLYTAKRVSQRAGSVSRAVTKKMSPGLPQPHARGGLSFTPRFSAAQAMHTARGVNPCLPGCLIPGCPLRAPGAWRAPRRAASRHSGTPAPHTRCPSQSTESWAQTRGR